MKDRFDLEQDISNCWGIIDALDDFLWAYADSPNGSMSEDEVINVLNGIRELYAIKFQKMEDTFNQVFKINEYYRPESPSKAWGIPHNPDDEVLLEHLKKVINRQRDNAVGNKPFKNNKEKNF